MTANIDTIDTILSKEIEALGAQIEEKVLTGYTLADAIREGASVTRQAHGQYGEEGKTCALTAAALAAKARGYAA